MMKSKKLAVLILAAGSSSRLGEPKQLVLFEEKTLLENACKKALELDSDVFVVLGSHFQECKKEIEHLDINIIENRNYKDGLSTSIKVGVKKLEEYEKLLIILCDQPLITTKELQKLIDKSKTTDKIICSFYKDDVAVPAIFPKSLYKELFLLKGDRGAKTIIKKNKHEAVVLDEKLAFDVDTQEDKSLLL